MGVYMEYVILFYDFTIISGCLHTLLPQLFSSFRPKYENGKMYANPKVPKSAAEDPWSKIVRLRAYPQLPNIRQGDCFPFVICHNVIFFVC